MPFAEHQNFELPPDDEVVWRYFSMSKFIDFLQTHALWFTRSDLMGDDHEGSLPLATALAVADARRHALEGLEEVLGRERVRLVSDEPSLADTWRKLCHVSSWHRNPYEASWMWTSYVPANQGVAVKTTVARLKESLAPAAQLVHVGCVKYLDYRTAILELGNAFIPVLSKRVELEGERELRMVLLDDSWSNEQPRMTSVTLRPGQPPVNDRGEEVRGTAMTFTAGSIVNVDASALVEEVRIAPGAGTWAVEALRRLVESHGLSVPVNPSSLDGTPMF